MKSKWKRDITQEQPNCPHCGGIHFGQRFDNCSFVNIVLDRNASKAQKLNAQSFLDAHRQRTLNRAG